MVVLVDGWRSTKAEFKGDVAGGANRVGIITCESPNPQRSHAASIRFGHSDAVPRVTAVSQLQALSNVQCPAASVQGTKSLRDSGEVGLVLSTSLRDEIVGSGGSRLS